MLVLFMRTECHGLSWIYYHGNEEDLYLCANQTYIFPAVVIDDGDQVETIKWLYDSYVIGKSKYMCMDFKDRNRHILSDFGDNH